MAELAKGAKMLAALCDSEDDQEAFLLAARKLADATSKLFQVCACGGYS